MTYFSGVEAALTQLLRKLGHDLHRPQIVLTHAPVVQTPREFTALWQHAYGPESEI